MARPATIEDDDLIGRLGGVFREMGFHAASLGQLAAAAGLRKASLYHRFPAGKEQMAAEVIAAALGWFEASVFAPLRGEGTPEARLAAVAGALAEFYDSGRRACLLNVMASPHADGPFGQAVRAAFEALVAAFAGFARDVGHDAPEAQARAERVVMLLHGSLVMARGLGTPAPFRAFLDGLPRELIGLVAEGQP